MNRRRHAGSTMHTEIKTYNTDLNETEREICGKLATEIDRHLHGAESKIWHRHPVWFLDENPVVGYSKMKHGIRLLFWSGQSFSEKDLLPEGSFQAAEVRFTAADQINAKDLKRWLGKAVKIQWDYKNIVKRKGKLVKLTKF